MICSTSCSSKAAVIALAFAVSADPRSQAQGTSAAGSLPAAAAAPRVPEAPPDKPAAAAQESRRGLATRIALLPPANMSGQSVPLRELQASLEAKLRAGGLALVSGGAVDEVLARHRLRHTGGVDGVMARAAREELGADALLVTAVTLHNMEGPHGFGMSMRLVSAQDSPAILWMDEIARTVDEAPGLFDLGIAKGIGELMEEATSRLVGSLVAALAGTGPAIGTCPTRGRFAPRVRYRAAPSTDANPIAVAALPFVNETRRPDAGELLALEFVRELARHGGLRVYEPGVVREELLSHRVIMEGGVSHETARIALGAFEADVVVAGYVRTQEEYPVPRLEFTVLALDTRSNRVLWESTSYNLANEGITFFDLGRVSTTPGLACRMVRSVVDGMAAAWEPGTHKRGQAPARGFGGARANGDRRGP